MCNRTQRGQKWLIGTVDVDGCRVPIVEYGATREEAERQAQQTVAWFWAQKPQLEVLDLPDLHDLKPGG
jgi:hypothetical protein